jgi:hypothetical protein
VVLPAAHQIASLLEAMARGTLLSGISDKRLDFYRGLHRGDVSVAGSYWCDGVMFSVRSAALVRDLARNETPLPSGSDTGAGRRMVRDRSAVADTAPGRSDAIGDSPEPGSVGIVPDRADPGRVVGESFSGRQH